MSQIRFVRFGIVGAFVTFAGLVVLMVCVEVMSLNPQWANMVQAVVAIELNFWLNSRYTWHDRLDESLLVKWIKFHLGKILSVGLNQLLFFLLVTVLDIHYMAAYFMNVGVMTTFNFLMNEKVVFRSRSKERK